MQNYYTFKHYDSKYKGFVKLYLADKIEARTHTKHYAMWVFFFPLAGYVALLIHSKCLFWTKNSQIHLAYRLLIQLF